jgi:3-phosphoshikimate 1-carboxyvinyltransferase
MSQLTLRPGMPLRGQVGVPGDKSISHRALLLGAIADGVSHVEGFLPAADCLATLHTVRSLGIDVQRSSPTSLRIVGRGLHGLREPEDVLNCSRSGTTLRLLAGMLAGQPFTSVLTGEAQLRRRPMRRVVEPLREMGATILGRDDGRLPPLAIRGGALRGVEYSLPVASAQVKSALLLAGLYADSPTTLHVPGPARDHTERLLAAMGCDIEYQVPATRYPVPDTQSLELHPAARLAPLDLTIPGDFSSAAFLAVASALVPGSEVTITGVGLNPTRSGLLDVLQSMGARATLSGEHLAGGEPVADLTIHASPLRGVEVGGTTVVRMIDEFPILAVAATQAEGETVVREAAELRFKETDRIATAVEQLRRLGAGITAQADGFVVHGPTPLTGARVHSHGDHRLAMALAVAGLVAQGETIVEDVDCIDDSFPGFVAALAQLGADLR